MTSVPRPSSIITALTFLVVLAGCSGGSGSATPEEQAAAVSDALGPTWGAEVVEDARNGAFVVANPRDAEIWRLGESTDGIAAITQGTAWADFWLPSLDQASSDRSNVRAMVVDTSTLADEVVSWQVNVNAADPGLDLDVGALTDDLRTRFEAQGLEVDQARAATWNDRPIALVAFEVPAEIFGGQQRYIRQWYIAVDEPRAMWSLSCDAPAAAERTEELCRRGLEGFRIVAPTEQDRA